MDNKDDREDLDKTIEKLEDCSISERSFLEPEENDLTPAEISFDSSASDCTLVEKDREEQPPEDFRSLNVTPTIDDLLDFEPYLRPAKINDAYTDAEHYRDVQFRLLREDFLTTLRTAVQDYIANAGGQQASTTAYRNTDLRIYRRCRLSPPEKGITMQLSFGRLANVKWSQSKRLMHGSLVLLSSDNFRTRSYVFATIVNPTVKELEKGVAWIEFCRGTKHAGRFYDVDLVMLESRVFFEPYLAVMNAFRQMTRSSELPMGRYLVEARSDVKPPKYLRCASALKYKGFLLPIGANDNEDDEERRWPSAEKLRLDETQYDAFRHALTEEFALVQGPPGTGKTFISLEIVSTLLANKSLWLHQGPILVVCYTNHALDQFLEGILKHTESIVRIGGQSKSDALEAYTLAAKRKDHQGRSYSARSDLRSAKAALEETEHVLGENQARSRCLAARDAILGLKYLRKYHSYRNWSTDQQFLRWLLGDDDARVLFTSLELPEHLEDAGGCELVVDTVTSGYGMFRPLTYIDNKLEAIAADVEFLGVGAEISLAAQRRLINQLRKYEAELREKRRSIEQKLRQHPLNGERRSSSSLMKPDEGNDDRWREYWSWVQRVSESDARRIPRLEAKYRELRTVVAEARDALDVSILKEHEVVGVTTTSAARLFKAMRELRAPIVLVEEAAEIFESHVVSSLTPACQHAILIGDHKQLQPKAATYDIGRRYKLNVSLFERMVEIRGGSCPQLAYQHRMRPEIARLITPAIYETLHNDRTVYGRESIKGLDADLYFLDHRKRESCSELNESTYENEHEAKFLLAFAAHLVMQGYAAEEITLLCTYTGQLLLLQKEKPAYPLLDDMRVTTVDNYQGEENKIILLSLVRNNGEGHVGFLREENRVCVALSRARDGLFIMGSMEDLVARNKIWPQIERVLKKQNAVGDFIQARCQNHPDTVVQLRSVEDFEQCPEGGCLIKCEALLACGHLCARYCHVLDAQHEEYKCKEPCEKSCEQGHPCKLLCWQDCGMCLEPVKRKLEKCGHTVRMACFQDADKFDCNVKVKAILPVCGHEVEKLCSESVDNSSCEQPCEKSLPCGHLCEWSCHANKNPDHVDYQCAKECTRTNRGCEKMHPCRKLCHEDCDLCVVPVNKWRACGHQVRSVECYRKIDDETCEKPCTKKLDCGHKCPMECSEPCGNCQVKVKKTSTCGHKVALKCCEEATPAACTGPCQKLLPCGHRCTKRCKEACSSECRVSVMLAKAESCGHVFSLPCYLREADSSRQDLVLKHCEESCRSVLACGHLCSGTCGRCLQGRIHEPCATPCSNVLACGHRCEKLCGEECTPCRKPCEVRCPHRKCGLTCGADCEPCGEKCKRGCRHRRCSKKCHEPCALEPCREPCSRLLKCGHPCVGLCGAACPPLCRICDRDELTEIFFGKEDAADARFVYLEDCKHSVESTGFMKWMKFEDDSAAAIKACPRCGVEIKNCPPLTNEIKQLMQDESSVKRKLLLEDRVDLGAQLRRCSITLQTLKNDDKIVRVLGFSEFSDLLHDMDKRRTMCISDDKKQNKNLSFHELKAFEDQLKILTQILDVYFAPNNPLVDLHSIVIDQVKILVKSIPKNWMLSKQTLNDIQLELRRLFYMVIASYLGDLDGKDFATVKSLLLSPQRFSEKLEEKIITEILNLGKVADEEIVVSEEHVLVRTTIFKKPCNW